MSRKTSWTCLKIVRHLEPISDDEMNQRLAQVVDELILKKSQLRNRPDFSTHQLPAFESEPLFNPNSKRRTGTDG